MEFMIFCVLLLKHNGELSLENRKMVSVGIHMAATNTLLKVLKLWTRKNSQSCQTVKLKDIKQMELVMYGVLLLKHHMVESLGKRKMVTAGIHTMVLNIVVKISITLLACEIWIA